MKKALSLFLAFMFIITSAVAETIDVSTFSDEELTALTQQLQAELFKRHSAGTGVSVPPGRYTAGADLPAGRYQVIVNEDVMAEIVEVYTDSSDKYGKSYWLGSLYGGTTANITLEDGNILEIKSHTVIIRLFTSLF